MSEMAATRLAQRPQLSEEVADHVRTRIMSGEVRPGDFIRLDETAAALGVSVTPVREALLTLRGEGLVDLVPRRGYLVSPMSRRDVEDIFWLQAELSRRIVDRAITRFDEAALGQHARLVEEFEAAAAAGDPDRVVSAQYALHRSINRASRSDKLSRFLNNAARYMPYRLYADDPAWRADALIDNRRMLEALRTGDVETAHAVIDAEFSNGADLLIAHLQRAGVWDEDRDGDGVTDGDDNRVESITSTPLIHGPV
ncbi:GntR family transcriptional regulator [Dietzia natronolimnaea]|uniref:GntR family transcriptional regulator n=2 Tax=Dietzia natronolimnaea TaxID=161920 RepID=A0A2A2WL22_9ACTN|nr:GntR family transcriptional regulator [Dietzia natronolimnaea]PAY21892.1 GntR family transcriptional regulator [Dietzia natronolimnaea]